MCLSCLERTGHHGGDGDGSRYMGGARIQKKENGSWQPQQEEKGAQLPSPDWRVGFGRLFYSPMSMLSDSRPKAAHRCFSPVIRWTWVLIKQLVSDLSVDGARLVSDQVLLKFIFLKRTLTQISSKVACGEVLVRSMEASPVSETQWEGMALPPPFCCHMLCWLSVWSPQTSFWFSILLIPLG